MRLWSIHPSLLDTPGLNGAWKEGICYAQPALVKLINGDVTRGVGRGYHNHAQLERFWQSPTPLMLLGTWLTFVHEEAVKRGFKYDYGKILKPSKLFRLTITEGQLEYEFDHLQAKLMERDESRHWFNYGVTLCKTDIDPHPMFEIIPGEVEAWEKVGNDYVKNRR